MHQFGVVQHLLGVQHVEVLVEELPHRAPLRPPGRLTGLDQVFGVHAELAGLGQHRPHLGGEPPGREGPVDRRRPVRPAGLQASGQRLPDPELLLRPGQQPDPGRLRPCRSTQAASDPRSPRRSRGRIELPRRGEPADQGVTERVEGHGERGQGGPPEPAGDPGPQIGRSPPGEGQRQHPVRGQPAVLDPVHDGLDQRGRLAGARPGQHQQRPGGVLDDRPLILVQLGRLGPSGVGTDQPVAGGGGLFTGPVRDGAGHGFIGSNTTDKKVRSTGRRQSVSARSTSEPRIPSMNRIASR